MRFVPFIHEFGSGYPGQIGSDDVAAGVGKVLGKTHDGLWYQGQFGNDQHAAAIKSQTSVAFADRNIYAQQGITYDPWGVVNLLREGVPDEAFREGDLAGQVAIAAAGPGENRVVILDLEPHERGSDGSVYYVRDDLGAGDKEIDDFCYAFTRAIGTPPGQPGGGFIDLCPDARPGRIEPVHFSHWCTKSEVRRCYPQVYSGIFHPRGLQESEGQWVSRIVPLALQDLDVMIQTLAANGWDRHDTIWPVLDGSLPPQVMESQIEYVHQLGCGGFAIWQRMNLRADTAAMIRSMTDPWGNMLDTAPAAPEVPAPPVTPNPTPGGATSTKQQVEAAIEAALEVAHRLQ